MTEPVIIGEATLYLGDCREILPTLGKVDAVVTDPPYGITSNKWDVAADPACLWSIESPVYVVCAGQPFTSQMVMSKLDWFKHEWVWVKNRGSNFANTVREPMKEHESVLIFAPGKWTYNKQMQSRTGGGAERVDYEFGFRSESDNYRKFDVREGQVLPKERVPSSWQKFNTEVGEHPTQKPVDMMDYFVRTYTNAFDAVLDPFMGSGTTGVACARLIRKFIGIEKEPKYFDAACRRIEAAAREPVMFVEPEAPQPKPVQEQMI